MAALLTLCGKCLGRLDLRRFISSRGDISIVSTLIMLPVLTLTCEYNSFLKVPCSYDLELAMLLHLVKRPSTVQTPTTS